MLYCKKPDKHEKILILILFPTVALAQQSNPANIDSFSFVYTGIEKAPGASATLLRSRAKYFIYQNFNDPSQVIRYDDADGGPGECVDRRDESGFAE